MSAIETHDLRKDRYFPGELVVSASQLSSTLAALARNVLFLRGISASMTVSTPPRFPTDDAGLLSSPSSHLAAAASTAASQIDLRFDESHAACVDAKSIDETVSQLVVIPARSQQQQRASASLQDWQLRPSLMSALAPPPVASSSSPSSSLTMTGQNALQAQLASRSRSNSPQPTPVAPSSSSSSAKAAVTASTGGAPSTDAEPPLLCTAQLIILKVAIESAASSPSIASGFLGALSSAFSSRTKEVVEEWCIPTVILREAEASQLHRHVARFRAQQLQGRAGVFFANDTAAAAAIPPRLLSSSDVVVAGKSGSGGGRTNNGGDSSTGAPMSSLPGGGRGNQQLIHPSVNALARVFSRDGCHSDSDSDDAVMVSEEDVAELSRAGGDVKKNSSSAATSSKASPASKTKVQKHGAVASNSIAPPSSASASSSSSTASGPSLEALEMLCAMLEPDSAARLQRIVLWMQSAVLDPGNTMMMSSPLSNSPMFPSSSSSSKKNTTSASSSSHQDKKSAATSSRNHHAASTTSVFETAAKVSVSVSFTSFLPRDARLVERRTPSVPSSSSFGNSSSAAASPTGNTAGTPAAAGGSVNPFRGFSLPALW